MVPGPVTDAASARRSRARTDRPGRRAHRRPGRPGRRGGVGQRLRRRPGDAVATGRRGRRAGRVRAAGRPRPTIAARAAGLVDEVTTGRLIAVAANRARRLIGVGVAAPGTRQQQHTGRIELLLVDPAHSRAGLGSQLLAELLDAAGRPRAGAGGRRRSRTAPAWTASSAGSASPNGAAGRAGSGWAPTTNGTRSCWELSYDRAIRSGDPADRRPVARHHRRHGDLPGHPGAGDRRAPDVRRVGRRTTRPAPSSASAPSRWRPTPAPIWTPRRTATGTARTCRC